VSKFLKVVTEERWLLYNLHGYEHNMRFKYPALSMAMGRHIETSTVIVDLHGGFVSKINKQVYKLMQQAGKISSDFYPEISGLLFVVNSSMLFTGVWAIAKSFMDEQARKKVKILGSKYQETLLKEISAD
jgi:hypothetical protein